MVKKKGSGNSSKHNLIIIIYITYMTLGSDFHQLPSCVSSHVLGPKLPFTVISCVKG